MNRTYKSNWTFSPRQQPSPNTILRNAGVKSPPRPTQQNEFKTREALLLENQLLRNQIDELKDLIVSMCRQQQ